MDGTSYHIISFISVTKYTQLTQIIFIDQLNITKYRLQIKHFRTIFFEVRTNIFFFVICISCSLSDGMSDFLDKCVEKLKFLWYWKVEWDECTDERTYLKIWWWCYCTSSWWDNKWFLNILLMITPVQFIDISFLYCYIFLF